MRASLEKWFEVAWFWGKEEQEGEKFFDQLQNYELIVYQVEDQQSLAYLEPYLRSYPGVVVLHDAFFVEREEIPASRHPQVFGGRVDWEARQYFSWPKATGKSLFVGEQLEHSLIRIFTAEKDYRDYQRCCAENNCEGDIKAFYLPLPIKIKEVERGDNKSLKLGMCGGASSEYRVHKILEALQLRPCWSVTWIVPPRDSDSAQKLLSEYGQEQVRLVCGNEREIWPQIAVQVDVAVHLQHSAIRGGNWAALQSMASGCAVLVSNFGFGEYLPDGVVSKIDCGYQEVAQLVTALDNFTDVENRKLAANLGCEYVRTNHDSELIASELIALLDKQATELQNIRTRLQDLLMLRPAQFLKMRHSQGTSGK